MKRQATGLFLAGALALLSMALPSCKEACQECTCKKSGLSPEVHLICRENYDTQQQYKATLKHFENTPLYGNCVCMNQ